MTSFGKKMPTIHPNGCEAMTWEDAERMEKRNEQHGWGFTAADCLRLTAKHMDADFAHHYEEDPDKAMAALAEKEMIEWRLTDANFHTFCGYLREGNYNGAVKWVLSDMMDTEERY